MEFLAAIDCGSNSFHLIIAQIKDKNNFEIVRREREVIRIGENQEKPGYISSEKMQIAASTLQRFKSIAQLYNAHIKAVATSAIRNAINREEFRNWIMTETGISINIVDGNEEARLIFLGIKNSIPIKDQKVLCIDIGGGSTEVIIGQNNAIIFKASIEIGAVSISNQFFPGYLLSSERIIKCLEFIEDKFVPVCRRIKETGFEKCIGSSGTIICTAFMIKRLTGEFLVKDFDINNYSFSKNDFLKIKKTVLEKPTTDERKNIRGIDKGRADIIPAGILILSSLFDSLSIENITVSGSSIREGIIYDTLLVKM
jgi:exopolyphosphatase / guanosine-5'-triphosphate,3'-diphosphate pyrophosphatase